MFPLHVCFKVFILESFGVFFQKSCKGGIYISPNALHVNVVLKPINGLVCIPNYMPVSSYFPLTSLSVPRSNPDPHIIFSHHISLVSYSLGHFESLFFFIILTVWGAFYEMSPNLAFCFLMSILGLWVFGKSIYIEGHISAGGLGVNRNSTGRAGVSCEQLLWPINGGPRPSLSLGVVHI